MARYETFGEIVQAVLFDLGYVSPDDVTSEIDAAVRRKVNEVHRVIHTSTRQQYLRRTKNYRKAAKVTASSGASVSVDGVTLTLAAAATAHVGRTVLLGTSELPYRVTGASAGVNLTIFPGYAADANLVDGAYTIFDSHITTPDDFSTVLALANTQDATAILPIDAPESRRRFPAPWSEPTSGNVSRFQQDGQLELASAPGAGSVRRPMQILLLPINTEAFDLEMLYVKNPDELVNDSDVPNLPPEHRPVLKDGSYVACGQSFGDKDGRQLAMPLASFREGLQRMMGEKREAVKPAQLGSIIGGEGGIRGNLPEDDVYGFQWGGNFHP